MAEKPLQSLTIQGLSGTYVNTPLSTAPVFNNTTTYVIGDYVFYNRKLYKFIANHAAGDWNSEHVIEITIGNELKNLKDESVTDVQIDDTSIVTDGVANIPIASANNVGLVKILSANGIYIDNNNDLALNKAVDSQIKNGTASFRSIVPSNQHNATFYGLAKAAGDTTQSSSDNAVGMYTDEAKIAIQKMLGIYEAPWELIEEITLTEDSNFDRYTEPDGTPYNFKRAFVRIFVPANTPSIETGYGRYYFEDENNAQLNCETGRYATATYNQYKLLNVERYGTFAAANYTKFASVGGQGSWNIKQNGYKYNFGNIHRIYMNSEDLEPAGTIIQIYAQRAY